jgi:site-specific recombinase XerD
VEDIVVTGGGRGGRPNRKTTAGRRLEKIKSFLAYCLKLRWVATNHATDLKAIKPDDSVTLPLLSGRYEQVIAATYDYDENAGRPSDMFGAELRAIIELMRWTGLRIGDALLCARSTGDKEFYERP